MTTYKEGIHVDDGDGGERLFHSGSGDVRIQKGSECGINQVLFPTSVAFVLLLQLGADGLNFKIRVVV